jgi:signal transduction histidine kinase
MQIFVERMHKARIEAEQSLAREQERSTLFRQHSEDLSVLLSEREEIIRQLTLSNKSAGMGALVASIAHELNQPLTTIVLKTELIDIHLSRKEAIDSTDHELRKLANLIQDDTRHAAAIILTLRSLFSTGKGAFERMDLACVAHDVIQIVRARAEKYAIALDIDLRTPLPMTGDVTQIQQVVLNLLNNAIDALIEKPAAHGVIRIQGDAEPGWVVLTIADNGGGIASSQHEDIFSLFKTSKSQGMGVGLWLSRSIASSHRGHLTFESELGQGAIFSLSLPSEEFMKIT